MANANKALDLIAAVTERDVGSLTPSQHLMADLGVDSPKALRLIMDIEDALGLEIDDDEAAKLETVGDILDLVERHGA